MSKENDILKWFNGELSAKEIKALYPDEDFTVLEKSAFYTKQLEIPDVNVETALADFKQRVAKSQYPKVIPLNFKSFLKIAAVFLVLVATSYALFFNNSQAYSTDIAQTKTLNLPDNSEVILNAKSKLSYNKKLWKTDRRLELEGEAFFKVTKGKTFTVNTNAGAIKVLGTQFNVKERDNFFEVHCYEGSVRVTCGPNTVVLMPGNTFRMVNGVVIPIKDFNADKPSWLAKESTFDKVPLWQVIDELEYQYNITIKADTIDTSILYTGGFTHANINIALQSVTIPLKLSYNINGNAVEFYNYAP